MGNSGSGHNLNSERSAIDRNSHFPTHFQHLSHSSQCQYQLSRFGFRTSPINPQRSLTTEWRRSCPSASINKESKSQAEIPFKVLPELDKRLHLRATSNGAILNSGGTISGRKQSEVPIKGVTKAHSQRSKTFIHESVQEGSSSSNGKNQQHPEFTRSQTLLYVKAKKKDSDLNFTDSNLSRMQRHTYSEPELINKLNPQPIATKNILEPSTRPSNRNKYTKKRRAPEAPPAVSVATPIIKNNIEVVLRNQEHAKPIHFAKNSDRLSKSNKPIIKSVQNQSGTFQRGHEIRNSVNGNHLLSNSNECPKFAYRREKSSDAIMLKSRKSEKLGVCSKAPVDNNRQSYNNHSNIQKSPVNAQNFAAKNQKSALNTQKSTLSTQNSAVNAPNFAVNTQNSEVNAQKSVANTQKSAANTQKSAVNNQSAAVNAQKSATNTQNDNADKAIVPVQGNKTQRTFYFGMDMDTSVDMVDEKLAIDAAAPIISNYDIEYKKSSSLEENLNDNGLLVHIRPTLPRRQVDTPSFSPALAWRSLLEDKDRTNNSKIVKNQNIWPNLRNATNTTVETPIQPNRTKQIRQAARTNHILPTWTPEQDLGDDHDDRVKGLSTEDDSSSDEYRSKCDADNFLFYGSKAKKGSQEAVTPVHTFSLSLPRDAHIQHTRSIDILNGGDVCIYKSLQKPKAEHIFKNNNNPSSRNTGAHVQQDFGASKIEGSNNWLLHKNVSGMEIHTKSLEYGSKRQRLLSIEPQSIKFLTGGKHVMYLPGSNDQPNLLKVQTVEPPQADMGPKVRTNRHFKSRQRHMPQSLQDKTPIFPIKSINEPSPKLDEDKPFHQRFSFNNPVRLLEKKLHADKSIKATKTQMSLEGELEALKKVEEDFQRNRANEKENLQHQLRLHFGADNEHFEQYHSLPIAPVLDRFSAINLNDTDNQLFCRDDPEGCVSNVPYAVHESEDHKKTFVANNILS